MKKDLQYYLQLPYPIVLTPLSAEGGGGWLAEIPALEGCMSDGATPDKAVAMVKDAMSGWIETAIESGIPIAEPVPK